MTSSSRSIEHLEPAGVGQPQVEDHDVRATARYSLDAVAAGLGGRDVDAFRREHRFEQPARRQVVVDQDQARPDRR
jgi:hypothetical protein